MLSFLNQTDSYFFLNVYPYFTWILNPTNTYLNYSLFGLGTTTIPDDNQLHYSNMLDMQLDILVAAMAALGFLGFFVYAFCILFPIIDEEDRCSQMDFDAQRNNSFYLFGLIEWILR